MQIYNSLRTWSYEEMKDTRNAEALPLVTVVPCIHTAHRHGMFKYNYCSDYIQQKAIKFNDDSYKTISLVIPKHVTQK